MLSKLMKTSKGTLFSSSSGHGQSCLPVTLTASSDKLHEECAVFGVSLKGAQDAAGITYNGLLALQHRGQEGAGIVALIDNILSRKKGTGLVSEAISAEDLNDLSSAAMVLGHNRYSTSGAKNSLLNIQPFVTEYLTGRLATAHNGNLTNSDIIKDRLKKCGLEFRATSDSEVISSLIAFYTTKTEDVTKGIVTALEEIEGAFSLIVLSSENKLIAARDPKGYRPLCLGKNDNGICVASESCALDSCGFTFLRDVLPGEIVVIENGEVKQSAKYSNSAKSGICIFEYIYFARPDSVIDGLNVYEARFKMGQALAKEHPADADAVCGVPDSGLEAAMGYANASGLPLISGFVKNRYIGRSFIYPTQEQREDAVRLKLNPLRANVTGKKIVLVDDSIVRGTTCAPIIKALKIAGAKEIHMRISSPPFIRTCNWGTDIGDEKNLVANHLSITEICQKIGADSLGYISIQGLKSACEGCALGFCTRCFD